MVCRLWHELTGLLEIFLTDGKCRRGNNYRDLYVEFITKFENRLSPIKLAQLVGLIGKQLPNAQETANFLSSILKSPRTKLTEDATMYISLDIAIANVSLGNKDAALTSINNASAYLAANSSTESVVYSKFYHGSAVYRKAFGPAVEFLKVALMFLGYTPIEQIPLELQLSLAEDLCIAAISSEEIFNFGEVVAASVLKSLPGSPLQWLHDLVTALNDGDMDRFTQVVSQNQKEFDASPLAGSLPVVKQKVILLGIMNLVFSRPAHDRNIPFTDVATATGIPLDEVEWALMKALSLNLIKGSINEVEQSVEVSWVQPRMLNMGNIEMLCSQLAVWTDKVTTTLTTVEGHASEL